MNKISIYIHFPFCTKKCSYCNFYSVANRPGLISKWADAIIKEINMHAEYLSDKHVETIYIGGGSPNLIPGSKLEEIYSTIEKNGQTTKIKEFTIELNPSHWEEELIKAIEKVGINRVSVGVQAFQNKLLNILDRQHTLEEIEQLFIRLAEYSFDHISLDLIFGIPEQTMESWRNSLKQAQRFNIDHLSLYNLNYEEGTPLYNSIQDGKYTPLEEEKEWQMYQFAHNYLKKNNFEHYEISNWSQPDCKSIHNANYWNRQHYIGFGPGAHSYNGKYRKWNKENVEEYIKNIEKGEKPPHNLEKITPAKARLEKLFLSLRTSDGITYNEIEKHFSVKKEIVKKLINNKLPELLSNDLITLEEDGLKLTLSGWFASNSIIAELANLLEDDS